MAAAGVIKAVDVLEDGRLRLPTRFPRPAPDQLGLDGLEECLDGGVVIAIALAAHRYLEAVFAQDFLVVVGAVLGSTGQRNGSFEGISRRLEAKRFSWPRIEPEGNLIKVVLGVNG